MKIVFWLVAVFIAIMIYPNEPVTKQVQAKEKPRAVSKTVVENAPIEQTAMVTPSPTPVPITPKEQAKATLIDLGHGDAWYAVEYIAFKESSWNPAAHNSIGACGLFQALPCSKLNCDLSDIPCQIRWANNYAIQHYGSWYNAYIFWQNNHWW